MRHGDAAHFAAVLGATAHHVGRNHTVVDDACLPVDILQKAVQGRQALRQADFKMFPLGGRQDPGQTVDRDNPLVGFGIPVDSEGDALI